MLNLSQVQAFVTIIDEGNFRAAAEKLSCAQPTISQQLQRLEEFLGMRLVSRHRARSTLTRDGELFLPKARALLNAAIRACGPIEERRLLIGASSNIGVFFAPRLIAGFNSSGDPAVHIDLAIGSNRQMIDMTLEGSIDLALTEVREDHSGFEWRTWRREKLVVIASPRHELAKVRRISKNRLFDYPMLGGESGTGTGRILKELLGADVSRLKISRQLGSTAAVKEAVKADLGISVVLAYSVAEDIAHGSLVSIDLEEADIFKPLYLMFPEQLPERALAQRFIDFIADVRSAPV